MSSEAPAPPAQSILSMVRRRILTIVTDNPGICLSELEDKVGISRTAIRHHLRKLRLDGLIHSTRLGRRLAQFDTTQREPLHQTLLGLVRRSTVSAILREIQADPQASWNKLGKRLGFSSHTIRWHIDRLRRQGVLEVVPTGIGRGHTVRIIPDASQILGPLRAAPGAPSPAVDEPGRSAEPPADEFIPPR